MADITPAIAQRSLTEHMVALDIALKGLPQLLQVAGRDVLAKWVRGEIDARSAAADLNELARVGRNGRAAGTCPSGRALRLVTR